MENYISRLILSVSLLFLMFSFSSAQLQQITISNIEQISTTLIVVNGSGFSEETVAYLNGTLVPANSVTLINSGQLSVDISSLPPGSAIQLQLTNSSSSASQNFTASTEGGLYVNKFITGGSDEIFGFTLESDSTQVDSYILLFEILTISGWGVEYIYPIPADSGTTYSVIEDSAPGWAIDASDCQSIVINPGYDSVCEINNQYTGGTGGTGGTPRIIPSFSTRPIPGSGPVGTVLYDDAILSGGNNPTGIITFKLYDPNNPNCDNALPSALTSTVNVNGNNIYSSDTYQANTAGTWHWTATYSGDVNNVAVSSFCSSEPVDITTSTGGGGTGGGTGSITVIKNTSGGVGNETFSFTSTMPGWGSFEVDTAQNSGSKDFFNIATGTYTITETVPGGWTLDSVSCTPGGGTPIQNGIQFILTADSTVTCTFGDNKTTGSGNGSITTFKITSGQNGIFSFTVKDTSTGAPVKNFTIDTSVKQDEGVSLPFGTYLVEEISAPSGWTMLSNTCDPIKDPTNGSYVTISQAQVNQDCTVTNSSSSGGGSGTAQLTINKKTTGGDATFFYYIYPGPTIDTITTANGVGSVTMNLSPGSYDIIEDFPSDWSLNSVQCSNGATKTSGTDGVLNVPITTSSPFSCTFNNSKTITGTNTTLKVQKVLVPSSDAGKFNLTVLNRGNSNTTTVASNVTNGGSGTMQISDTSVTYTVSETAGSATNLSDYVIAISGDCAADGSIRLNSGDNKTCTITNTKSGGTTTQYGSITVYKSLATPVGGPETFTYKSKIPGNYCNGYQSGADWVFEITTSPDQSGFESGSCVITNVPHNTYLNQITEFPPTNDWASTANTCDAIVLDSSTPDAICDFVNEKAATSPAGPTGSIKITKTTFGGDNTFKFKLESVSPGLNYSKTFDITTMKGAGSYTLNGLEAGTYTASEVLPANWNLNGTACDNGDVSSFDVVDNDTTDCIFDNVAAGRRAGQSGSGKIIGDNPNE